MACPAQLELPDKGRLLGRRLLLSLQQGTVGLRLLCALLHEGEVVGICKCRQPCQLQETADQHCPPAATLCTRTSSCLRTCSLLAVQQRGPSSMVPSRESCLLRCLGTFWQGAYSTVHWYCAPRSETKERPWKPAPNLSRASCPGNARKAKPVRELLVLHSSQACEHRLCIV